MRLGYFGGSFDPPHLGHLVVARAAADAFYLDRVLLVPTASQPLKLEGAVAAYADRLAMTALLCKTAVGQPPEPDTRLQASDLEAPFTNPPQAVHNYTVDTLLRLRLAEPAAQIYVIVGIDAFQQLPLWRSPDLLLTLADWIVVSRPDVPGPLPPLTPAQHDRVHLLSSVDVPASATAVRAELAHGGDCFRALPSSVLNYIRSHHLYTR